MHNIVNNLQTVNKACAASLLTTQYVWGLPWPALGQADVCTGHTADRCSPTVHKLLSKEPCMQLEEPNAARTDLQLILSRQQRFKDVHDAAMSPSRRFMTARVSSRLQHQSITR